MGRLLQGVKGPILTRRLWAQRTRRLGVTSAYARAKSAQFVARRKDSLHKRYARFCSPGNREEGKTRKDLQRTARTTYNKERHKWPCHNVYNVHHCHLSLESSQCPHPSQLNYIYNFIYLSPVPTALHCPSLRSTTAHALQSPLLILSIALNALIIFFQLFLGILEVLCRLPCGLMCRVTCPKD